MSEHEVGNDDNEKVNVEYISNLLAQDWGFYYTATMNLKKVKERTVKYQAITEENRDIVCKRVDARYFKQLKPNRNHPLGKYGPG